MRSSQLMLTRLRVPRIPRGGRQNEAARNNQKAVEPRVRASARWLFARLHGMAIGWRTILWRAGRCGAGARLGWTRVAGQARFDQLPRVARVSQLDALLFSHFHVDHSGDFAALIKSSWFEDRHRPLRIYGPPGNDFMPATTEFVWDFFGDKRGAYRYLSELLVVGEPGSYKMQPHNVTARSAPEEVFRTGGLRVSAVGVVHGAVPALAWRVETAGKVIVFSGDTNGEGGLVRLAANADLFIAHNAVPEGAAGIERRLHMPPSVIGQVAGDAQVKSLVLS